MFELGTEIDLQLSGKRFNHALELMLDGIIVARRAWWLALALMRGDELRDDVFEAAAHELAPRAKGHVEGYSSHQLTA